MSEKEFLRKKEMQDRAFLQWVARKNEEEKVPRLPVVYSPCYYVQFNTQARRAAIKQQEELKLEQQRQKILMGKAAYSQWIKLQKEKDKLLLKQRRRENGENYSHIMVSHAFIAEQARLDHQQHLENQKKVQEVFENWKAQKDLEQRLAQQASDNSVELRTDPKSNRSITDECQLIFYVGCTPTVPGYCSVWLCDDEMREYVCTIVPRQPT